MTEICNASNPVSFPEEAAENEDDTTDLSCLISELTEICSLSKLNSFANEPNNNKENVTDLSCLLCGTEKKSEIDVQRHIRFVHLMDQEYLCNYCHDFSTFSLAEWASHVSRNHSNNPPKKRKTHY